MEGPAEGSVDDERVLASGTLAAGGEEPAVADVELADAAGREIPVGRESAGAITRLGSGSSDVRSPSARRSTAWISSPS